MTDLTATQVAQTNPANMSVGDQRSEPIQAPHRPMTTE
jgi:hypothetical protein